MKGKHNDYPHKRLLKDRPDLDPRAREQMSMLFQKYGMIESGLRDARHLSYEDEHHAFRDSNSADTVQSIYDAIKAFKAGTPFRALHVPHKSETRKIVARDLQRFPNHLYQDDRGDIMAKWGDGTQSFAMRRYVLTVVLKGGKRVTLEEHTNLDELGDRAQAEWQWVTYIIPATHEANIEVLQWPCAVKRRIVELNAQGAWMTPEAEDGLELTDQKCELANKRRRKGHEDGLGPELVIIKRPQQIVHPIQFTLEGKKRTGLIRSENALREAMRAGPMRGNDIDCLAVFDTWMDWDLDDEQFDEGALRAELAKCEFEAEIGDRRILARRRREAKAKVEKRVKCRWPNGSTIDGGRYQRGIIGLIARGIVPGMTGGGLAFKVRQPVTQDGDRCIRELQMQGQDANSWAAKEPELMPTLGR